MRPRRRPYTARGIPRVTCAKAGCTTKGYASWQVCADGRVYRVLCKAHDIELNAMVLSWVGDPHAEQKMIRYKRTLNEAK